MKRFGIMIALCLLVMQLGAQNISQDKFESLVDYVNGVFAKGYIEKYIRAKESKKDTTAGFKKEKAAYAKMGYDFKTNSLEVSFTYAGLKDLLTNHQFGEASQFLVEAINKNKEEYKSTYDRNQLIEKALLLTNIKADKFKPDTSLINSLRNELQQKWAVDVVPAPAVAAVVATPPSAPIQESPSVAMWNMVYLIILEIIGAMILVFAVYWFAIKPLQVEVKELTDRNKAMGKELQNLKKEIEPLRQQNALMETSIAEQTTHIINLKKEIVQPVMDIKETVIEPEPVKKLYLSTPNADGSFVASASKTSFQPTASYYCFDLMDGTKTKAKFSFCDDPQVIKQALETPQSYLDPVCEPQNTYTHGANRIVTIEQGTVELDGDRWILKTKAKIRYE